MTEESMERASEFPEELWDDYANNPNRVCECDAEPSHWGHCSGCNVPLTNEMEPAQGHQHGFACTWVDAPTREQRERARWDHEADGTEDEL